MKRRSFREIRLSTFSLPSLLRNYRFGEEEIRLLQILRELLKARKRAFMTRRACFLTSFLLS